MMPNKPSELEEHRQFFGCGVNFGSYRKIQELLHGAALRAPVN